MAGSDTHGATIEKNIGPGEDVLDRISVGEQSESKPVKYFAIVENKTCIKEIFYKIEVPFVLFYEVECWKGQTLKACLFALKYIGFFLFFFKLLKIKIKGEFPKMRIK